MMWTPLPRTREEKTGLVRNGNPERGIPVFSRRGDLTFNEIERTKGIL